jgi:hypothetical protein
MSAVRASDQDREQVVAILRDQHTIGRLSLAEFHVRCDAAFQATTWGDLLEQVKDLPVQPPFLAAQPGRPAGVAVPPATSAAGYGYPYPVAMPGSTSSLNIPLLVVLLIFVPPAGIIYLIVHLARSQRVVAPGDWPGGAVPGRAAGASYPVPPPGQPGWQVPPPGA